MENAVDALKIGFAVIVFTLALGLAFAVFSQARATSDIILYANDKTNYEEYLDSHEDVKRIVGIETIIPTVRRYVTDNENYSIEIIDNGRTVYTFDLIIDQQNNLTPNAIKANLEKSLEELLKKYSDSIFEETFSEEIYRGKEYVFENGETIEKMNTDTKVKITYKKINS